MTLSLDPSAASPAVTLEGVLERVVFSNEETAWSVVVLSVAGESAPVTAVGNLLGIQPGENLRLTGTWVDDPKYGRQLKVRSYATVPPSTVKGIERYLASGLIRGIGKRMAARLVAAFGKETLDVIENHPERLREVGGLGKKRIATIREAFLEQRDIREVMVFLQSHGVSTQYALRIFKTYGASTAQMVRENPYRLALDIHGIGFKSADRIAAELGIDPAAPQRLEAGALHVLSEAADRGNLFLPRRMLVEEAARLLAAPATQVDRAVGRLAGESRSSSQTPQIIVEPSSAAPDDPGEAAVYLKALHAAETGVAARIRELLAQAPLPFEIDVERALNWFERTEHIALARQQRQAIRAGLTRKVLVVTGGPGTGKTTLVRGLVKILEKKSQRILLAAPTGRAAKRLAEATGGAASTIHRLLEFEPRSRTFLRNREHPLSCDLLIVDEASMLDTVLAGHLLRALPDPARLVLVGDVDQLPSVGPGRVLADLIRSNAVEVVRLTEIFRQAERSLIVVNAHRVNRGEMPLLESPGAELDYFFLARREPEEIVDTLCEVVSRRIPARFGLDPVEQIQVLTPRNRGPLGIERLNERLRDLLNPQGGPGGAPNGKEIARGGRTFRIGDKVMQVRNNYDLEVFNGDIGRVTGIDDDEGLLKVTVDGREVVYEAALLDELVLAYACTIHKAQGSEYPCVVIPLHTQHYLMLQRNLLYTALTRAKRLAVLVGEPRALAAAVSNRRVRLRFTRLAERLGGVTVTP